jgi:hypothetical protein
MAKKAVPVSLIEPAKVRAVTSASNYFRRRLCLGSGREEAKYGPEPDTEYSEEGKLLHRLYLTGERPDYLTVPQWEVLDTADNKSREFIEQVERENSIPDGAPQQLDREVSLSLRLENVYTMPGHADVIITYPEHGIRIILDAKFGYLEVDEAPNNDQLAIYEVMAQQGWPTKVTYVAIVQPRNFGPRITTARYDVDTLASREREILRVWKDNQKPDAPLTAGEKQCHFCRAKAKCPAYLERFAPLYVREERAIELCTNEELVRLREACAFAHKIAEQVNAECRRRTESGRFPGFKLQNSGDDRTVKDSDGMYQAFKTSFQQYPGWSATAYDACREVVWGKLEAFVKTLTRQSDKKVKELVREIADPFCTITPKAKRVVRE